MRIVLAVAVACALVACHSTVVRSSDGTRAHSRAVKPKYGSTVVVRRGDTLYGIAFRNGLDVRSLAAWNGIGPPYTIYPGQKLRLYPGETRSDGRVATARPPAARAAAPVAPANPAGAVPGRAAATAQRPGPGPAARVASNVAWRWPADGQLLTRFVAGEPTRQGIDIAGKSGAPVRAAADGVVVYSGSGLVGYGELIIVKHNDAWLSAYGHNRARMVNEGALVRAGQQIAVMGRTGAPRDMLHFEIRYNGKPVDPLAYLPRR